MSVQLSGSLTLLLLLFSVSAGCGRSRGHDKGETTVVDTSQTPISILVTNSVTTGPKKTYGTYVVYRGILLGGMRRLQAAKNNFTFTYTENQDYGPFLESVNGLAGSTTQRTYWELKVKKPNGTVIIPDVGIGCYIPSANDVIILNYSQY